jgi:hypothetical protein
MGRHRLPVEAIRKNSSIACPSIAIGSYLCQLVILMSRKALDGVWEERSHLRIPWLARLILSSFNLGGI